MSSDGKTLIATIAQGHDITKRKKVEEELRGNKERYRTTMMSVGDGVIATDTEGRVEMMNPAAEELTGWKQEKALGKSLEEIFHIINEETRQIAENPVRRVMREGIIVGLANHSVLIARDGTEHPIADSGAPIRNEKSDITGVVLVFRDQTQERTAQKALQESERKFRETVKYLDEGYYSVTTDGLLLDHNQAFNRILGFDIAKDMKGAKLPDFWQNPDDRKAYLQELMARGSILNYLINAKKADGEKIIVLANAHLVKDENDKVVRIEGTFTDFTDLKLAEEKIIKLNAELEDRVAKRTAQLEASFKELESFSYSVSHDLRAPLRHVSGYVELLNKHFHSDLPEKGQHYLNSIADSVRHMGVLIDDLLHFSRTGRMEMLQTVLDMNGIVQEVKESICKENPDRKIEWVLGKLPSVYGDNATVQLVWMNLLSNAVKFTRTRKKARIEIGVREEKKDWVFFVRDNGVGFDMQYAQKLFGVFQRLHSTEEFEGTGIGLANVNRIVLRHGGRSWAEAEPDKGAVFYFSIPK
jgi:PAS domain S-box-containing protein